MAHLSASPPFPAMLTPAVSLLPALAVMLALLVMLESSEASLLLLLARSSSCFVGNATLEIVVDLVRSDRKAYYAEDKPQGS
jgi:hypothetical protein